MEKLQELSQSELQELLDNTERVESMALESDEVNVVLRCYFSVGKETASMDTHSVSVFWEERYWCPLRGGRVPTLLEMVDFFLSPLLCFKHLFLNI